MTDTPHQESTRRLAELRAEVAAYEERSGRISALRGITFLGAAAAFGYALFRPMPALGWVLAGLVTASFIGLVLAHAVLISRTAVVEQRALIASRAIARMEDAYGAFPERGDAFKVPGHPYASDLDVFGQASLYQLVSVARTPPGEATLAAWLSAPAGAAVVRERQEAARELAGKTRFREDLALLGREAVASAPPKDPASATRSDPLLGWCAAPRPERPSSGLLFAARLLVAATVVLFTAAEVLGAERLGLGARAWIVTLALQAGVLFALRAWTEASVGVVASRESPFARYRALFQRIEDERLVSPALERVRGRLAGSSGHDASKEMRALERIVGFAELRHNGLVYVLANGALLWDVWCALALERWWTRAGHRVADWIEAVGEIEAVASLGTLAHERPHFCWPVVNDGEARLIATGLGHPLIPEARRVVNDVSLSEPGSALLITGSNMSGKSTLLRAIGVNAVLALAGAPVCADELRLGTLAVRTSMRLEDSLEHGVSHFYAELERLKRVVDSVNAGEVVLFLLDEILHGTNSRERQIGAKAVVTHIIDRGAIGAVSSHDLGLAPLEEESGGRVKNVHFEELVEDGKMTFDYKLKPGVVTTANALRLMKLVGIDVALPGIVPS